MAITPLPLYGGTAPNRAQSQSEFNTNMASWISYTTTFQPAYNTFATQANALAVEVEDLKDLTMTFRDAAASSAAAADSSQNLAAASADYKGLWSAQTGAANKPYSVFHNGSFWALNNNLANVTTQEPSLTNANWQFISGTRWQLTRTASFTVAKNAMENVSATAAVINATLPTLNAGDFICVSNNANSTQNVLLIKPSVTALSNRGVAGVSDNIIILPGQCFYGYAINSTGIMVINNG
jgi:hypothetical protein